MEEEGEGHRCCAELEFAQRCCMIPPANRATTLPATQPSSRPDFPHRWHRPAGTNSPLSHSRSWQDLCELARAPDVHSGVGRPRPDGHLVAKAGFALASLLHHSLSYRAGEEGDGLQLPALMHFCT